MFCATRYYGSTYQFFARKPRIKEQNISHESVHELDVCKKADCC